MTYDVVDIARSPLPEGGAWVWNRIVYARVSSDLIGPESAAESTEKASGKVTNECILRPQGERQHSTSVCRTFTLEVTWVKDT